MCVCTYVRMYVCTYVATRYNLRPFLFYLFYSRMYHMGHGCIEIHPLPHEDTKEINIYEIHCLCI